MLWAYQCMKGKKLKNLIRSKDFFLIGLSRKRLISVNIQLSGQKLTHTELRVILDLQLSLNLQNIIFYYCLRSIAKDLLLARILSVAKRRDHITLLFVTCETDFKVISLFL